jgi:hypothetical protein
MKLETRENINLYYNKEISSQKLIQYFKVNETLSNEEIYCEYHNINNICKYCGNKMKYSGFKHGFRCSKECSYKRKIKTKTLNEQLTKELIFKNVTKQNFISRKFLQEYNITEKQCYNIIYDAVKCKYCKNEAIFINWLNGYYSICESNECSKLQRAEKTKKTNLEKYGCENVSANKEIQKKKAETFKKNNGVDNISQLLKTQDKIRETMLKTGRWISEKDRDDKLLYEFKVRKLTEKQNIKILENYELRGPVEKDGWHLDHIYSIYDGFKNNIPIHIIANINNLRMIPAKKNQSKNFRSEIHIDDLINKILT